MYLVLDKKAPWRYTRGPFVFLDGLKSRLTLRDLRFIYYLQFCSFLQSINNMV